MDADDLNNFRVGLCVPGWRCAADFEEWTEWCDAAFPVRPQMLVYPVLTDALHDIAIACEGRTDKCRLYVNFVQIPSEHDGQKRKKFGVSYLILP